MLANLEQFRAVFRALHPNPWARDPRTTVVAFSTGRQFDPYKPRFQGKTTDVDGYCIAWSDEVEIALSIQHQFEAANEIIFHEYTHQLLGAGEDKPPLWLNEGMAEVFSSFRIEGDSYELGREQRGLAAVLRNSRLMPLGRLFAVTEKSPEYHAGVVRDVFYAESWALVHYLVCGKDRATNLPKLTRFLELMSAPGATTEASFREAFGLSYAEMEANLRRYLEGGSYFIRRDKLPLGDLSATIDFQPADDFDREVALINLRWRVDQDADATYRLLQLAESHPESPRPHEVLAAVAMEKGDTEGALLHWRRAVDLGSANPYIIVQVARDRLNPIVSGFTPDYRMPLEVAAPLRMWVDRAVTLSPTYDDAYEAVALVEAMAGQPRLEAVNAVLDRVPTMRHKDRTLFALAVVYWRQHKFPTSRAIAEALLRATSPSAELKELVRRLLERLPPPEPAAVGKTGLH